MARPKSPKKIANANKVVPMSTESIVSDPIASPVENMAASDSLNQAATAKVAATARKPEIVAVEPRTNLVSINLDDEIRQLAYLLSERRGFEPGHETEDWLNAEREILGRYEQRRA